MEFDSLVDDNIVTICLCLDPPSILMLSLTARRLRSIFSSLRPRLAPTPSDTFDRDMDPYCFSSSFSAHCLFNGYISLLKWAHDDRRLLSRSLLGPDFLTLLKESAHDMAMAPAASFQFLKNYNINLDIIMPSLKVAIPRNRSQVRSFLTPLELFDFA